MFKQKAFTLMELLVVISMIGILTTVTLVGVSSYRARGRDAQRIASINSIAVALQNYYADNHQYPNTLSQLETKYLTKVPSDPKGGSYNYALNGASYNLYAKLEGQANAITCGSSWFYIYKDGQLSDTCP